MAKSKSFMIKNVRCIYPNLTDPKPFPGQDEGQVKYNIKALIPKDDKGQISAIKDFIKSQVDDTDWTKTVKAQVYKVATDQDAYNDLCVIKDGDALNARRVDEGKEKIEAYEGHIVISLSKKLSFGPPTVVGPDAKEIPPMSVSGEIRSGYWVNIQATGYCYSKPKTGFSMQLSAVQKIKEDIVFGAANPFEPLESENPFDDESIPL